MKIVMEVVIDVTGKKSFDEALDFSSVFQAAIGPDADWFWDEALAGSDIHRKVKMVAVTLTEPALEP